MALPTNVGFCKISGRFIRAILDGGDADRNPDGVPIEGLTITITAKINPAVVRDLTAVPPITILIDPITVVTNSDGVLVDPTGTTDIYVVASDDPDLTPTGWTYTAKISGPTFGPVSFSFVAPAGGEIDLSTVVPVPASPGPDLVAWQAAVAATAANVAAAAASAAAAAQSAEDAAGGGGGGGVAIDDTGTSTTSVWSSEKTSTSIDDAVDAKIVNNSGTPMTMLVLSQAQYAAVVSPDPTVVYTVTP